MKTILQKGVESITIASNQGTTSILLTPLATLIFDKRGRPLGLYENDFYYSRGFSGIYTEKKWVSHGRHIRTLTQSESEEKNNRIIELLDLCHGVLLQSNTRKNICFYRHGHKYPVVMSELRKIVNQIIKFMTVFLPSDSKKFENIYNPIGILPPDQYFSLVIQMVDGCSWNRCSFCSFYKNRKYHVKTKKEMLDHVSKVKSYFGPSLSLRTSLFLGDANLFSAEPEAILWGCRLLSRFFPDQIQSEKKPISGLYAFGEVWSILKWDFHSLLSLKNMGMRRVYIGVETGADLLRRFLLKPGKAADVIKAVHNIKRSGISVGLIFLLGVAGKENEEEHIRESRKLLASLKLDEKDFVYFSPLVIEEDSYYQQGALEKIWTPLNYKEMLQQKEKICLNLINKDMSNPKTALYDVREFNY